MFYKMRSCDHKNQYQRTVFVSAPQSVTKDYKVSEMVMHTQNPSNTVDAHIYLTELIIS